MMKLVKTVFRAIFGLFVDDEFLTLATLLVVGGTAILGKGLADNAHIVGATLTMGCVVVLVAGVLRTARERRRD